MSDIEKILDGLRGNREVFRSILTDRDGILARMCVYALRESVRKGVEPWSIISEITGHGSGVSSAIYHLYRRVEEGGGT